MAFQQPNNVRSFNGPAGRNQQAANQGNKPDAYLNVYLPKRGGTRAKLGAFKMYGDNKNDSQVMEFLQNAPDLEKALEQLKGRLELDFHVVTDEVTEDDELLLG